MQVTLTIDDLPAECQDWVRAEVGTVIPKGTRYAKWYEGAYEWRTGISQIEYVVGTFTIIFIPPTSQTEVTA